MLFPLLAARGFRGVIDTFTGSGNLSDRIPDQGNRPWVSATGTISSNAARHTETLGAELATGNLVVGSIYQITATQADYFFTGCAINDYFQATATTALDANNKVKLLTQSTIETTANLGFSNGRYWGTPGTVGTGEIVGQIILSDGNNNFVRAVYSEGTGKLLVTKSVAGTFTTLINTAITYSAGAKLCLVHDKSEGKIWAFYNNATVGTAQVLTDASIINNTWYGILTTGTATVTAVDFKPSLNYIGVITGLRISSVDGSAFLDNASEITGLAAGNYMIDVYSATGRLSGYIKAAGTGVTYSDIVNGDTLNGNMETGDPPTGWTSYNGSTPTSVADERTGGAGIASLNMAYGTDQAVIWRNLGDFSGKLIYFGGWAKNIDATNVRIATFNPYKTTGSVGGGWEEVSTFVTCTGTNTAFSLIVSGTAGQQGRFDDVFFRQVLTPTTTGITIVSAEGGATENWADIDAAFTYNAASYVVFIRKE